MKLNKVVCSIMVLAMMYVANTAKAQLPLSPTNPPVWTDVMNSTNCTTAECGNFFPLGGGVSFQYQSDFASLSTPHTLNLAGVTTPISGTASIKWNCGGTNGNMSGGNFTSGTNLLSTPVTFTETYGGSGIMGVGFLGTFTDTTPFTLDAPSPANLFETVFFNENQCYGNNNVGGEDGPDANGREYGFFLASSNNSIWAYWGTRENQGTPPGSLTAQVNVPLTTCPMGPTSCTASSTGTNTQTVANGAASPIAGQEYYYEIYPFPTTVNGSVSCSFQVNVYTTGFNLIYTSTIPVNGNDGPNTGIMTTSQPITNVTGEVTNGADSSFCSVIAASSGDVGFASANVAPPAGGTGALPSTTNLNLNIQRLFVGKE